MDMVDYAMEVSRYEKEGRVMEGGGDGGFIRWVAR